MTFARELLDEALRQFHILKLRNQPPDDQWQGVWILESN